MENAMVVTMERHNNRRLKEYECQQCKSTLYQGYADVVKFEGDLFCDTHCLSEHLLETTDYELITLD